MNELLDINRHPCFNGEVKGRCGRVHLPVAANCNIKCNYCNRKYDCVNESRPGVTSTVLSPRQAVRYLETVLEKEPRITVAGIAGPGDPFANPDETLETLRLVREKFPGILLCLASNGLGLADYLDEIVEAKVSHVTVTVNAVDPEIGRHVYGWVRDRKVIYRGADAARLLLDRQLEAIKGLKQRGVIVKVNTIVIPSINDSHVEEVARTMAGLGVDVLNCMPMYPNRDTPFENLGEPGREMMEGLRAQAGRHLPQMHHCTRCRADAAGLLEKDCGRELISGFLRDDASANRPYVAVATLEGMLVNLHLGEAKSFQIWTKTDAGFERIEERDAPEPGGGMKRWQELGEILHDCRAILVGAIGDTPRKVLAASGIEPIEMHGFIAMGLDAVYRGGSMSAFKTRRSGGCCKGAGCGGDGEGC